MRERKATDEAIAEVWKQTENYAAVGRKLGIATQTANTRVNRLRALGWDLPPSKPVGYYAQERSLERKSVR